MTTPRIYVGTYSKYNSGNLAGAWVDLEGHTKDSFYEVCKELHSDEIDPEFMFQDYEGFPESYYNESGFDSDLWAWLELDDGDRELLAAYQEAVDSTGDIDDARNAYYGQASSDLDFAEEYIESTGMLSEIPDNLQHYFDYQSFARDLMYDFSEANGYYFSRN